MIIKRLSSRKEIIGVKELQSSNLKTVLDETEISKQGFLTAEYSIEFLEKINKIQPSIIMVDKEKVIGYALVISRKIYGIHNLIDGMFNKIDDLIYQEEKLKEVNYSIVGQLCIEKSYRGTGLVNKIYNFYRKELSEDFKYLVTGVDEKNVRSIKAHFNTGFEIIGKISFNSCPGHIIIWNWNF
jgi:hypothetical protein